MQFLKVRNFEKFQHFNCKNLKGNPHPPWIKLYHALLSDLAFYYLPDVSKFHVMGLYLIASQHNNHIPYDAHWIQRQMGATETVDLTLLIEARFLEPDTLPNTPSVPEILEKAKREVFEALSQPRRGRWRSVDHSDPRAYKGVGGCYAIYGDGLLVYIGQSVSIGDRLFHHFSLEPDGRYKTKWGFYKKIGVKIRAAKIWGDWATTELRLIRRLKPYGNSKIIGEDFPAPSLDPLDRRHSEDLTFRSETEKRREEKSREEKKDPLAIPSPEVKYSADFQKFWTDSTRRGSKVDAYREWQKWRPSAELQSRIHAGMTAWQASAQWQDESKQPHVHRWLKRRGWDEDVPRNPGLETRQHTPDEVEAERRKIFGDTP